MLVAPLLNTTAPSAEAQRHFSAFPLTSHLHTPTLRLVSLHPFLSLTCTFLRVPEIHDGFQWKSFLSKSSDVRSALDSIVNELGLTKNLPVPGGGPLDYVLEEVWSDGRREGEFTIVITLNLCSFWFVRNRPCLLRCYYGRRFGYSHQTSYNLLRFT